MFKKWPGNKDEEETMIGDEIDPTKRGKKEVANKTPTRQISSSLTDIRRRPQQLIKLTQSEMNPRPKEGDLSDLEMDSIPIITSLEEENSKEALRRRSKQLEQIFTRDHSKINSSEHALKPHLFKPQAQSDKLEPLITKEVLEAIEPQFSKAPLNSR
uniref:Uncharacterized protein n=1 Tax=Timema poppense TaxID=170557 RepID=A0A7R9DRZ7_TIMPO|nr:unnamed protein product [Timema poppensis]